MASLRPVLKLVGLLMGLCLLAGAQRFGDLEISGAWSRPSVPGQTTGVVYLRVGNSGASADALTAVSTSAAASSEIHTMETSGGMMKMRAVSSLPVPAGGALALAPGGNHIMLMGLKAPLKSGDTIDVTLSFAHQGMVKITVPVQSTAP